MAHSILPLVFIPALVMMTCSLAPGDEAMRWTRLAPIPDAEGFAAPFAGVSGGALLVAGGANITARRWEPDFVKTWHDSVFVLDRAEGQWKSAGRLPRPLGYGVSISVHDRLLCLGGADGERHFAESFALTWNGHAMETAEWPALPRPCAYACGALLGSTIYVAGGTEKPGATLALKSFWALSLDEPNPHWRELEPCPGPERMLAVAGVTGDSFYLFSGTRLTAGPAGEPVREYLRDAYRFTPGRGWTRLADLPRAAVAAPSPAIADHQSRLLILTGDDGVNVHFEPVEQHPGFPRDVLTYDPAADQWHAAGELPFSRATVPTVHWGDRYVIPNGEARPRVRTPEVFSLQLP